MNRIWLYAFDVAVCAALSTPAVAQTNVSPGTPAAPIVQHTLGGIDYISGGAGEEDRNAMAAQQSQFPFKVVLSAGSGQYVVADRLSVRAPEGELLTVRDAGPLVMANLPPGTYTVEATWQGKTERRPVRVAGPQTLNLRFPD